MDKYIQVKSICNDALLEEINKQSELGYKVITIYKDKTTRGNVLFVALMERVDEIIYSKWEGE